MAKNKAGYIPPFSITSGIVRLVSEISEALGGFHRIRRIYVDCDTRRRF
jgi:hypothetical protein